MGMFIVKFHNFQDIEETVEVEAKDSVYAMKAVMNLKQVASISGVLRLGAEPIVKISAKKKKKTIA